MKIGLIDVDSHNFPNLALMKLSAWHKAQGDTVEWWYPMADEYDIVYMSKVFDETYSPDLPEPTNAKRIIKGGTGYIKKTKDGDIDFYVNGKWETINEADYITGNAEHHSLLHYDVEHTFPDYSLYPQYTVNKAYGHLTRGCPRNCGFCGVTQKEGCKSLKVADLTEWWDGQKNIMLLDPNLTACKERLDLLKQLTDSSATVEFNQGLDARLID